MHRKQIAIFVKIKCALYRKDEPMGAAGTVPTKTLCWELCVGCACKLQKATGKVLPNDWFPSRVIPNPPWSAATKLHRDTAKVQIWQTSNLYFGYRKGFCRTCDRASNNLSEEQPAYQLPSWWHPTSSVKGTTRINISFSEEIVFLNCVLCNNRLRNKTVLLPTQGQH